MPNCGTLVIEEPFDESAVEVDGCSNLPSEAVLPGETVEVTFTAVNGNENVGAVMSVEVVVDGQQVATDQVEVAAGRRAGGAISFAAPSQTGEFSVDVNKVSASPTGGSSPTQAPAGRLASLPSIRMGSPGTSGCAPCQHISARQRLADRTRVR